jgi:hypothetical protein
MITFEITYKGGDTNIHRYPLAMKDEIRNFWKRHYENGVITGWAITEIDGVSV